MEVRTAPTGVQIVGLWKFGGQDGLSMDVPEVAALLRRQLKTHYAHLRCTVRVTHRWHGWLRVRAKGSHDTTLEGFVRSFALLNRNWITDDSQHHVGLLDINGEPTRIGNSVRWVALEWAHPC